MLAALERQLRLRLALCALEPQHHFLGRLCFLVEDGFRLAAVAGLFAVVAAFALGDCGCLRGGRGWLISLGGGEVGDVWILMCVGAGGGGKADGSIV